MKTLCGLFVVSVLAFGSGLVVAQFEGVQKNSTFKGFINFFRKCPEINKLCVKENKPEVKLQVKNDK